MRLYSGTSKDFISDTAHNYIASKLKEAFFQYFRYYPSPNEVHSWQNSLRAISQIFEHANLLDHGIILEYQLPLTSKRLDCLICGEDTTNSENAVIIELKQWEKCEKSNSTNEVMTWIGGCSRDILHPSVQVGQYKLYLQDLHTAFNDEYNPISLNACTYLHNYFFQKEDALLDAKFEEIINNNPLFTGDDVDKLQNFLINKLKNGHGEKILQKIEKSKYKPSKKLMEHVSNIIKGKSEYILLDEQLVVYDKVLAVAKNSMSKRKKTVLIIKGGPGTGKSVIAINLMADLLERKFNAQYATGSQSFTQTLWEKIGTRGSAQFKYFNNYTKAEYNEIDVIICDEAHRLRPTSATRFMPKKVRDALKPQIQEILNAAKISVFLLDNNQNVRPKELGSSKYIKEFAEKNNCDIYEYELEAQFRCNGSDGFINWINNTLNIEKTANVIWEGKEEFDFKIFDSPLELEQAIKEKNHKGVSARITAGYCWPWSQPNTEGYLINDVVISDFARPWNARPGARHLAPSIPKATLWANDPNGVDQIGCVYTAQGFEFDYVGVIVGRDLIYDFEQNQWIANPKYSYDSGVKSAKQDFLHYVKNIYRVLLTRGMKGCYVYFMDEDTKKFFKTRMED
jgi:DUF2075 family protein/predicted DNA-binding WGR domain protein